MISPTRKGNSTPEAKRIRSRAACSAVSAAFCDESFRRHDYLLGRRNAQAFLVGISALPESDALFAGRADRPAIAGTCATPKGARRSASPRTVDRTLQEETLARKRRAEGRPWVADHSARRPTCLSRSKFRPGTCQGLRTSTSTPRAQNSNPRAEAVIATLIDVDLQRIIQSVELDARFSGRIEAFLQREGADWIAAPLLAEVLTKKAAATIKTALDEVREAFA